jgi:hypothetical protein
MNKSVSPSRRYVAMCSKSNFSGYYFKSFTLPEQDPWAMAGQDAALENTSSVASWYFMNRLDPVACIEGCLTEEDFKTVEEVKPFWDQTVIASAREVQG